MERYSQEAYKVIHTFKAVGQPMMLDVGSGAVHALDDMAYDVLEKWNESTPEEIKESLKGKYAPEELDEVIAELRQLEEIGALNAPDNYDDVKQLQDPGVVKAMCLHAAHDCNLRCQYCFAATGDFCMGERKLLPFEVGKAALDWLVQAAQTQQILLFTCHTREAEYLADRDGVSICSL